MMLPVSQDSFDNMKPLRSGINFLSVWLNPRCDSSFGAHKTPHVFLVDRRGIVQELMTMSNHAVQMHLPILRRCSSVRH